jgi:hypothetical protein
MGLNGDISSMQRGVRVKAIGTRRSRSWRSRVRFSSWSFRNVFLVPWLTCSEPEYEGNLWKKKIKEIDGNCKLTLYLVIYCCTIIPKLGIPFFDQPFFADGAVLSTGFQRRGRDRFDRLPLTLEQSVSDLRWAVQSVSGLSPARMRLGKPWGNHRDNHWFWQFKLNQIDLTWSNWILSWFSLP